MKKMSEFKKKRLLIVCTITVLEPSEVKEQPVSQPASQSVSQSVSGSDGSVGITKRYCCDNDNTL